MRRQRRKRLDSRLRLYRYDDDVRAAQRFAIRIELNAPICQRRDVRLRLRLDYRELTRIEPKPEPAWPVVSNIAESMASRADLPAQMTNWKAGK